MSRSFGLPRQAAPWIALWALALAGCGGDEVERRSLGARPPATVVATTLADIGGVNPLISKASDINSDLSRRFLFLSLARERSDFKSGPPGFDPRLAESWELSDDGRELTFRLRPGVVWSDGQPLTAADVEWTWRAQIDPDVAWGYASSKERIQSVEALDERTVVFRFRERYPTQLADAVEGVVLPRHAWGERPFAEWRSDAGWFVDNLVTSGPFQLESWTPGEEIVLVRNPRYFEPGRPKLERFVFRIVADKTGQINQLLGGDADYVRAVPAADIQRLEADPNIEFDTFWGRRYDYLCWNTENPLFADLEVRRALTHAIDRQEIIDALYGGYARPSISPIISSVWAFDDTLEAWPFDPQVAKLILAKNGWSDDDGDGVLELDGERFSFELLTNAGNKALLDAGTMIQEHLRRVGIEVRLLALEFNTYVERITGHEFEATLGGWNIDTSLDISYAFHTDAADGGYNFGSYSNREVDRLIDEAKSENDVEAKRELLHRLQRILHEEQPYTFLWEPKEINGRLRRVRDSRPSPISTFDNIVEWRVVD